MTADQTDKLVKMRANLDEQDEACRFICVDSTPLNGWCRAVLRRNAQLRAQLDWCEKVLKTWPQRSCDTRCGKFLSPGADCGCGAAEANAERNVLFAEFSTILEG